MYKKELDTSRNKFGKKGGLAVLIVVVPLTPRCLLGLGSTNDRRERERERKEEEEMFR